jgi:hypothetical protein
LQSIVESAPVKRRGNPYRDAEGKFCKQSEAMFIVDSEGRLKTYNKATGPPKLKKKNVGGGNPNHDAKGKFASSSGIKPIAGKKIASKAIGPTGVVKPKSKTAVKATSGEVQSLSKEQYDVLKPTGQGFSRDRLEENLAKLESTHEGKVLSDMVDEFQHSPSDQMRNEIQAVNSRGKYQTAKGTERAKVFLKASSEVPREILPDKLYRGFTVGGSDAKTIAAQYRSQGSTTLNISSFTGSPRIAREYTTYHVGAKGPNDPFVKVLTTVKVGKKAQMLPIQNISRGKDVHRDQEYLGLGTFKVNSVAVKGNEVHLEIEQIGTILPKEEQ